jgi:hypothetical protein
MRYFLLLFLILFCDTAFGQNDAFIKQFDNAINSEIQLVQIGKNNLLTGFSEYNLLVEDANGIFHDAAYQFSSSGGVNKLITNQKNLVTGKNEIFLFQQAMLNNTGIFDQQDGTHTLMLKEISSHGSNTSHINQLNGSGFINLEQRAYQNNTIPSPENTLMNNPFGYTGIYQKGENNFIYGAAEGYDTDLELVAVPAPDLPAQQISETGSNWLEIWQTGGNNVVGLYQEAVADNKAFIKQFNGFNKAVIYQQGAGFNSVKVTQSGGAEAYIYQKGAGNNNAVIEQY